MNVHVNVNVNLVFVIPTKSLQQAFWQQDDGFLRGHWNVVITAALGMSRYSLGSCQLTDLLCSTHPCTLVTWLYRSQVLYSWAVLAWQRIGSWRMQFFHRVSGHLFYMITKLGLTTIQWHQKEKEMNKI